MYCNKIFILSTSGHCGVDWIHSCLDGHPDIVITPAISLLRSMAKIKKRPSHYTSLQRCIDLFTHYFKTDNHSWTNRQTKRRALFRNEHDFNAFIESFSLHYESYMLIYGLNNSFKRLFYSLNYAYADLIGQEIDEQTIIVHQEHVPFHSLYYKKMLNPSFIYLVRDPRAMYIGSWVGMRKAGLLDAYHFSISLAYYTSFMKLLTSTGIVTSPVYLIQNELFNSNLKFYMQHLCDFLCVRSHSSLFTGSINGQSWLGESCYIEKEEAFTEDLQSYYQIENVRHRWLSNAQDGDISYIESLCFPHMTRFGYDFLEARRNSLQRIIKVYTRLFSVAFSTTRPPVKKVSDFMRLLLSYHFPLATTSMWLVR